MHKSVLILCKMFSDHHGHGTEMSIVKNLHSKLAAVVHTKSWTTQVFPIRIGVFQGDPLSVNLQYDY